MRVEKAVSIHLKADAGVSALVGNRVWQLKVRQGSAWPAVLVQLIDEPKEYHLRGEVDLTRARVQADCYGSEEVRPNPYDAILDVAEAVTVALSGKRFVVGDRLVNHSTRESFRPFFEPDEQKLIRVSMDFYVYSKLVS